MTFMLISYFQIKNFSGQIKEEKTNQRMRLIKKKKH